MGYLGLVATQATAQEPPTTWTLSFGARESNQLSRVQNGVDVEGRIRDSGNVRLGFSTRGPRSRVGLFGRAGANFYRRGDQNDRTTFGGGLAWNYQSSERLEISLGQNLSHGLRGQTLSELGVLGPDIRTNTAATSWGLRYRTSPRTTISTALRYHYSRMESDQAIDGSQLVLSEAPTDAIFPDFLPDVSGDSDLLVPDAEDSVIQILATEGLSSRESTNQATLGSFGLSTSLTERTTFGFSVSGGYRSIESLSRLRKGAETGGQVWAERLVGVSTSLRSSYSIRRSVAIEPATTLQALSGGVAYSPSSGRVTLRLNGGASYFQARDRSLWTPTADASFSAAPTRSSRINGHYRRQFQQSLGFGRTLLIDFVNASASQDFGSRVTLTALAGGSFGTDPLEEASRLDARRAGATLRVRLLEPLNVGTSFHVLETEQFRQGRLTESRRNLWTIFLNVTKSWH